MHKRHPWRLAQTLDGLAINRSLRLSAYLDKLPDSERRLIENAERAYLTKTWAPHSFHRQAAQDFESSLRGIRENEPVGYRGFVT